MKRDCASLANERFDLLVVGGGVHGAAAARAGTLLGLRTALIEQGDFGHATSANSLKIIHGGLRYLQHGNLRMVREGVRARRQMMALFPHLISPLPCVVPTCGLGVRGKPAMAAALALNDLLAADRNRGLPADSRLPRGRILSRAEMLNIAPGLPPGETSGGALWYDGLAEDTERLVLALACDAAARGACAANYVRAEGFLREGGAVTGVRARDLPSGAAFDIRARVTLNAAGPWLDLLAAPLRPASDPPPLAKAVNIVIGRRLFGEHAVGLAGQRGSGGAASGKRFFFFVPWRGGTMIGTLYLPFAGRPEECAVSAEDLALMTAEVNRLYPAARLDPDEVRFAHVGVLPLVPGTAAAAVDSGLARRPLVIDGARAWGVGGVLGIRSVKYTSACRIADEALAAVLAKLDRAPAPRREPEALLEPPPTPAVWDGGSSGPETDLSRDVSRRIRLRYGAAAGGIFEMVRRAPQLARRVTHDQPTVAAELIHAIREEAALCLCDLLFRRTPLGTAGHPGREALAACAAIAAAELRWDETRREREIGLVEQKYRRLLGGRTG